MTSKRKVTHQAVARDGSILTRTSDAINTPDGLRYRWVVVTFAGDGPHGAATWHGTAELARASARGFSAFESYILPVTPADPKVSAAPQAGYQVGQNVEVFSFGRWYLGTVTSLGRRNVKVLYRTGSGATRDKAFGPDKVRPLPPARLPGTVEGLAAVLFPSPAPKVTFNALPVGATFKFGNTLDGFEPTLCLKVSHYDYAWYNGAGERRVSEAVTSQDVAAFPNAVFPTGNNDEDKESLAWIAAKARS